LEETVERWARPVLSIAVVAVVTALAPIASADDWTQYKHDAAHTGSSEETQIDSSNVADLGPGWTKRLHLASSPLAVNGTVIVSGRTTRERRDGRWSVRALSLDSGSEVWRATFAAGRPLAPEVITGGAIVLKGATMALDADSGDVRWMQPARRPFDGLTGADGVVYGTFHGNRGCVQLRAIATATGKLLWSSSISCDDVLLQPRPSVAEGRVYITRNYGATGEVVVANDVIYFEGEIAAYDAATGNRIGKDECEADFERICALAADGSGYVWNNLPALNSWAFGDGVLFGGCIEAAACALDAATGQELWHTPHESLMCTSDPAPIYSDCKAIVANGVAYLYHPARGVHAFDAVTGENKAIFPDVRGDPIVVDGSLVTLVDAGVRAYQHP
jgi:outer membrane protein assembly factor BamB